MNHLVKPFRLRVRAIHEFCGSHSVSSSTVQPVVNVGRKRRLASA